MEQIKITVGNKMVPRLEEPFLVYAALCPDCVEIVMGRATERINGSSCTVCLSAKKTAHNENADMLREEFNSLERKIRNLL